MDLFERNHTLRDGIAFLAISCSFHGLLMLISIIFCVLESINPVHGVQYHFECDHVEVDGRLQAQHKCFVLNNIFCALRLQAALNYAFFVVSGD